MTVEILINGFVPSDTNVHSYQTDPEYFFYPKVGRAIPPTTSFTIWVYNLTNEPVTVTPITNIVNNGSAPDAMLVPSYTVDANDTDMRYFPYADFPINYLSLMIQFSTVPTTGSIIAYLILNGADPVVEVVTPAPSTVPSKPLSGFYEVIITETGLPTGSVWSANVNGVIKQTNTNQIIFYETNGNYSFQIYGSNYYGYENQLYTYSPSPASGTVTVSNGNVNINVTFTGTQTPMYDVYSSQAEVPDILNNFSIKGIFSVNNGDIYTGQSDNVAGYYNFSVNANDNYMSQSDIMGYYNFSVNADDNYTGQSDSFTYTNS